MEYLSAIPCYKTKRYSINRTSIKLRYNHFLNNSPKYDDIKEVEKLYKDCIKYNESFKTNPNDEIDYLDLSVFEEYGFKNIPVYESKTDDKRKDDFENDNWGEPNSMETGDNDFSIEEIINMPSASDLESEDKQKVKQNIEKPKDDKNTSYEVPTRVIHMKKKEQNREIPLDVKIQQYADDLYEQHGYGTDYDKSIFIVELAEKFPGLDDYEKYYNSAKKLHDLSV